LLSSSLVEEDNGNVILSVTDLICSSTRYCLLFKLAFFFFSSSASFFASALSKLPVLPRRPFAAAQVKIIYLPEYD
jgi:hypothetical protein